MTLNKKIAILTSSRADYSIYTPLLAELSNKNITYDIIAFGSHTSFFYGNTIQNIKNDGYKVNFSLNTLIHGDTPETISDSMGLTIIKFSELWKNNNYCLIIALGDRYEMFSAVISSLPFNIPIAHISGGEVTLGAIDNVFRDSLSVASDLHFTSTAQYSKRVAQIKNSSKQIHNVGALNVDYIKNIKLYTIKEFYEKFKINLNNKTILITFHPETVGHNKNKKYITTLIRVLKNLKDYQIVITQTNADTNGLIIRSELEKFAKYNNNIKLIESFGSKGYITCMHYCKWMLGNTSSGFVEATYKRKIVINIGDRQKGRILTSNIINSKIIYNDLMNAIRKAEKMIKPKPNYIYGNGSTAKKIVNILQKTYVKF